VVGLCATLLAMLMRGDTWPWPLSKVLPHSPVSPWLAIVIVLLSGALIGLMNGLLVTKVRVQAFVVTLCGLFVYRGASRWLAEDQVKGLGNSYPELKNVLYRSTDVFGLPMSLVFFLALAAAATVFL